MSKKTKRKTLDKTSGKYIAFKSSFLRSANKTKELTTLKCFYPMDVMRQIVHRLIEDDRFSEYLIGGSLPQELNALRKHPSLGYNDLDRELLWASLTILPFKETINEFVQLKNQYDTLFFLSKYDRAEDTLSKIEKK